MLTGLKIPLSQYLPEIYLDKDKNIFKIKGKSIPENAEIFYKPVFQWLDEYFTSPNEQTELDLALEYYNSSSARILAKIIKIFDDNYKEGKDVKVIWTALEEDEAMIDNGEDFKMLFNLPFEIKIIN